MSAPPSPSVISKFRNLNGWIKLLIAIAPSVLAWVMVWILSSMNRTDQWIGPLLVGMIVLGALIAAGIAVEALARRKPEMPVWALGLIFFAVGLGYLGLNYGGCCVVVLVQLSSP
ncbi:MAG: hypothetical protein HKN23_08980 [Verrucomicrobiales bacterium]|nr:hypothetical protein [Verrucomicrobiales bacterium]